MRKKMAHTLRRITDLDNDIKVAFEENPEEVFNWLIGENIPNVDTDTVKDAHNLRYWDMPYL